MNITIRTTSGISITQPEQKWLVGLLVALNDLHPDTFTKVCERCNVRAMHPVIPRDDQTTLIEAILLAVAAEDPDIFATVCGLVDNAIDAYATIPTSMQAALTPNH